MLSVECKLELEFRNMCKIITLSSTQPLETSDIPSCLRNEAYEQPSLQYLSFLFETWMRIMSA